MSDTFICRVCGEEVEHGKDSCPSCGACELTGWKDASTSGEFDFPSDDFNYEEYIRKEFGGGVSWKVRDKIVALIAVLLIISWILMIF